MMTMTMGGDVLKHLTLNDEECNNDIKKNKAEFRENCQLIDDKCLLVN